MTPFIWTVVVVVTIHIVRSGSQRHIDGSESSGRDKALEERAHDADDAKDWGLADRPSASFDHTKDQGLAETPPDPFVNPKDTDVVGTIRGRSKTQLPTAPNPIDLQFTAYYPQQIHPDRWDDVLFYAHLPVLADRVRTEAARLIRDPERHLESSTEPLAIGKGSEIVLIPNVPGASFNPPVDRFFLAESLHRRNFRISANPISEHFRPGRVATGTIGVFVSSLLIAEVSIRFLLQGESDHFWDTSNQVKIEGPGLVEDWAKSADFLPVNSSTSVPYQSVFASYSHHDIDIVAALEPAYQTLGNVCLRDTRTLRSGERWNPGLFALIDEADIFQLYWSEAASRSPHVEQEWRHALRRDLENFVRPLYWRKPVHPIPPELADLHFTYYQL